MRTQRETRRTLLLPARTPLASTRPQPARPPQPFWRPLPPVLAIALLLAGLLALPPAPAAAESGLEVLQVGWDGTVVPGTWSPVRVRATGGASDATARVEVILQTKQQRGPQATPVAIPTAAYGQEISLPAGSAKEITVWAPVDGGMSGLVRLTVDGRPLAEQTIEFRSARTPFWPLVGVLADAPAVARGITQIELPYQGLPIPLSVTSLAAADVPPAAARLNALSALVVQGNAAAPLTGEQRRAVLDWVSAGGHLVLLGGPGASRTLAVLPAGTLPLTFTGAASAADLSDLARWAGAAAPASLAGPAARLEASAGAPLLSTSDGPLAWRLGIGEGTVTLLAVDPSLQPLSTWPGTPGLLRKALEPALPAPGEDEKMQYIRMQREDPGRLQGVLDALPPEAFPDWRTIALILGGFTLLAGPLAHFALWRADRREWLWLAVPAAALALSASLYYFGVGRDGRDVLVNAVSHVRLDPAAGQARQSLAVGFYAPTHAELTVDVPGDTPVRAYANWRGAFAELEGAPVGAEPPFRVVGGRSTRVEFSSGQWAMRPVLLDRPLGDEVGTVTAALSLDGGLIKGTVRNDTPYPLEDAAVLVGQSLTKLGSLAPGQSVPVVLDPGPAAQPFQGGPVISHLLFGRPRAGASTGGAAVAVPAPVGYSAARAIAAVAVSGKPLLPPWQELEIPSDPEVQRRVRLLDSVLSYRQGYGPEGPSFPLTFISFTRAAVGAAGPHAGSHPTYHLTLLEQPLRLDLPAGPFVLPAALTPVETLVQATRGMGGGGNGTITWAELHGGTVTYGFRPPLPARARPEVLLITTQQIGQAVPLAEERKAPLGPDLTPGPAEPGVFTIYNWQAAAWEDLPTGESARIQPAAAYVGPDGLVKVQVSTPENQIVRFITPQLTVEGRVEE